MTELEEPAEGAHGQVLTERVGEVVYTAITPLSNGYRDAFELSLQIPDETAGTTLYFPTVQTCVEGETAWIEIPTDGQDPHDLDAPSPSVKVVAGDGHGDGHDHDETTTEPAPGTDTAADAAESTTAAEAAATAVADSVATEVATEVATQIASELAAEAVPADDGGSNGLAVAALALAGLGVVAGGGALIRSRRS